MEGRQCSEDKTNDFFVDLNKLTVLQVAKQFSNSENVNQMLKKSPQMSIVRKDGSSLLFLKGSPVQNIIFKFLFEFVTKYVKPSDVSE